MIELPKINPLLNSVNIYFIIPTKDGTNTEIKQEMYRFVERDLKFYNVGIKKVFYATGYSSIFEAYNSTLDIISEHGKALKDEDIFVLCHDDISIQTKPESFIKILKETTKPKNVGFVGVAGTTELGPDAVWWNHEKWQQNKHSGFALHGKEMMPTYYGHYRRVVVLDGLFLACSWRTLKQINLTKPPYFIGDWDFYDLHYTLQAHKLGLSNLTVPIVVNHMSRGELVGKDGWQYNRLKFIENERLPVSI